MTFSVALNRLTKHFGETVALADLTEQINTGDRVCLIGHNGAGKTTLLNMIAGISKPTSGTIKYLDAGQEIKSKIDIRKRLSYLSHEAMMYPDLTAMENLLFFNRLYQLNLERKELENALESVGMGKAANRIFRTCSRGMQQRLSLARALLPKPSLLLLDEPFSGLDPAGVKRMTSLIHEIKSACLLVTHNLTLGYEIANRFWILRKGRLRHQLDKETTPFEDYLKICQNAALEEAAA